MDRKLFLFAVRSVAIVVTFLYLFAGSLQAQHIQKSVVSSGATVATNENIQVHGTVGQTLIGISKNPSSQFYAGFWYPTLPAPVVAGESPTSSNGLIAVTPHPVTSVSSLAFTVPCEGVLRADLLTMTGKYVQTLFDDVAHDNVRFDLNSTNVASGTYVVQFNTACGTYSSLIIIKH